MTGNQFIDELYSQSGSCSKFLVYNGRRIRTYFEHNFCILDGSSFGGRSMLIRYDYSYEDTKLYFDMMVGNRNELEYEIHSLRINICVYQSSSIISIFDAGDPRYNRSKVSFVADHNGPLSEFLAKTRSTLEMIDLNSPNVVDDYFRVMNGSRVKRCEA